MPVSSLGGLRTLYQAGNADEGFKLQRGGLFP